MKLKSIARKLPAGQRLFNRELSLLAFHERVLALAQDDTIPLLERLRFLCISSTNVDEFFEVRVARMKHAIELGAAAPGADGMELPEVLSAIARQANDLIGAQYRTYQDQLLPAMAAQGIVIAPRSTWTKKVKKHLHQHFRDNILPVLSPFGLDPARPFPQIINKSLNFIVGLRGNDALNRTARYAVVQAPRSLPRLIRLPAELGMGPDTFVFLASLIRAFTADVFPGMQVQGCHQFRVTRNSDLFLEGEDFDDLMIALKDRLAERQHAAVVRMEMSEHCAPEYVNYLREHFGLTVNDCYGVDGPVNLNRVSALYDMVDRPDLKDRPLRPALPNVDDMFSELREHDVLLHHPYDSFAPVIAFLRQAARDPKVLAIKQTLYRTGPESTVVDALVEAAQAGKEVTVVIELRARFDEADNIQLANRLHEAGVHVAYGVVGFKTHAKLILVVRQEEDGLKRYVHLGTGNYHPSTAKVYTDYGLFTADTKSCEDVHSVFLQLTGLSQKPQLKRLRQAPFDLHASLLCNIEREATIASEGRDGRIIVKVNSLVEPRIIDALYYASKQGVQIDLIVRGMCCLRPGVEGLSDNIRVRSILGRFLEHSRVYYFHNDGADDLFCASADWMDRNFFRRVEVSFPIRETAAKARVLDELALYLQDEAGAWQLSADGSYQRLSKNSKKGQSVQKTLLARSEPDTSAAPQLVAIKPR
ncbi:MAG: polyphosphate kinase 1 [Gammaproteobacteria bacterium]